MHTGTFYCLSDNDVATPDLEITSQHKMQDSGRKLDYPERKSTRAPKDHANPLQNSVTRI